MFYVDILIVYMLLAGVIEGWATILSLELVRFLAHLSYERLWNWIEWGIETKETEGKRYLVSLDTNVARRKA